MSSCAAAGRKRPFRGGDDGIVVVGRHQAVPPVLAERAIADAVGTHDHRAQRHPLERGYVEALERVRQEQRDSRAGDLREQHGTRLVVTQEHDLAAGCGEPLRQAPSERRLLGGDDQQVDVALRRARHRIHLRDIDAVRDREDRPAHPAGGRDRARDLRAGADPDGLVREEAVALQRIVGRGVQHVLEQVDDGHR